MESDSDQRVLQRLAVLNEVLITAGCLFVLDSRSGERQMSYRIAHSADPRRLANLTGKYIKQAGGYIYLSANGEAEALDELPPGVSPYDVIADELDDPTAAPLQDRLRAIACSLRADGKQDDTAEELAKQIDAILEACRPDNGEHVLEQVRQWLQSDIFNSDSPRDAKDEVQRACRFLDRLRQLTEDLQGGRLADGKTIGGVLAIRQLALAAAARAENPGDEADSLMNSLFYITAGDLERIEHVAARLCDRMIRLGDGDAVREAFDSLKAEGDALISQALDGDVLTFYNSLYPAAAFELAATYAGQALARASHDPSEQKRWAKRAVNAEERAVRVSTALGFAIMNLDGSQIALHVQWLRQVREEKGDQAARRQAKDLIRNQLFYPMALLPVLLGQEPLRAIRLSGVLSPDDRSQ